MSLRLSEPGAKIAASIPVKRNNAKPTRKIAWHYTIDKCARQILSDGYIQPATKNVPLRERPCVWFSSQPVWEPTANKAKIVCGRPRSLTFADMRRLPGGLWRFGLPVAALLAWKQIQIETNMSRKAAKGLIRAGRKMGADPDRWYGAMEPVAVSECLVQRLMGKEWLPADVICPLKTESPRLAGSPILCRGLSDARTTDERNYTSP